MRDESRAGAGTIGGSQWGFFPGMLQMPGRLWQKSYPLVCPDREEVCVGTKVLLCCNELLEIRIMSD